MRVFELAISNFRGIKHLEWRPPKGLTCLVGPGDSTKTTILDALSLVLTAGWNHQFDDADFTSADTDSDIVIAVILTDLSDDMCHAEAFGYALCGVDSDGVVHSDPLPGCETAVRIELRVDASLEPIWSVVKDEGDEPRRLSGRVREQIAAVRLDDGVDRHLRWARGAALTRLTGAAPEVPRLLADSHRAARAAVFAQPDPQLQQAADEARRSARELVGVELATLQPGLDPSVYSRLGSLSLHESELPLDSYGLGTKRLIGLSLQLAMAGSGNLLLIDEVEGGLDPHRLRRFISELERASAGGDQVVLVTHSPLVLEQLRASSLSVVRSDNGTTTVRAVPDALNEDRLSYKGLVRSAPSALLARRVIVGEGATEVGLVEGILSSLEATHRRSAAASGVAVANGSDGRQAAIRGRLLAGLGYAVAIVVDHDDSKIDNEVAKAALAGVEVIQWAPAKCLEDQIFEEVDPPTIDALFDLAVDIREEERGHDVDHRASLRSSVAAQIPGGAELPGDLPSSWLASGADIAAVRYALGTAAHKGKWFKRQSHGQRVGALICSSDLGGGLIATAIDCLREFAFPSDGNDD